MLSILFITLYFLIFCQLSSSDPNEFSSLLRNFTYLPNSHHILSIGDSIDRNMVKSWCDLQRDKHYPVFETRWGSDTLKYNNEVKAKMGTNYCYNGYDSLAFVHVYGSADYGPYFLGFNNSENDPYIDTIVRIPHALSVYVESFGYPTHIILQFTDWDIKPLLDLLKKTNVQKTSLIYHEFLTLFEHHHRQRIEHMQEFLSKPLKNAGNYTVPILGLRTAASASFGKTLIHDANEIIRSLAKEYHLLLYDLDRDLWSGVRYHYNYEPFLFMDQIHPNVQFAMLSGEKLLQRRYTRSLVFYNDPKNIQNYYEMFYHLFLLQQQKPSKGSSVGSSKGLLPLIYQEDIIPKNISSYSFPVMLLGILPTYTINTKNKETEELPDLQTIYKITDYQFIVLYLQTTKSYHIIHHPATNNIFDSLRLNTLDILPIHENQWKKIKSIYEKGEDIIWFPMMTLVDPPIHEFNTSIFVLTHASIRPIPNPETTSVLYKAWNQTKPYVLSHSLYEILRYHLENKPVADMGWLHSGTTVQYHNERVVYVITELYHRKVIANFQELLLYINDTSEIHRFYSLTDIELIPL